MWISKCSVEICQRGIPLRSKLVGLLGGEPSSLILAALRRRGQFATVEVRYPIRQDPAENRMKHVSLLELTDSERLGPAPLIGHEAQEPTRLAVIRLPVENRAEALARQPKARGLAFGRALGQSEQVGGRSSLDFLELELATHWLGSLEPATERPLQEVGRTAWHRPEQRLGESSVVPAGQPQFHLAGPTVCASPFNSAASRASIFRRASSSSWDRSSNGGGT